MKNKIKFKKVEHADCLDLEAAAQAAEQWDDHAYEDWRQVACCASEYFCPDGFP